MSITVTELSLAMDSDRLYWLTLLGGLVVPGASVTAVVREEELSTGTDWTVVRVAAIVGAGAIWVAGRWAR